MRLSEEMCVRGKDVCRRSRLSEKKFCQRRSCMGRSTSEESEVGGVRPLGSCYMCSRECRLHMEHGNARPLKSGKAGVRGKSFGKSWSSGVWVNTFGESCQGLLQNYIEG